MSKNYSINNSSNLQNHLPQKTDVTLPNNQRNNIPKKIIIFLYLFIFITSITYIMGEQEYLHNNENPTGTSQKTATDGSYTEYLDNNNVVIQKIIYLQKANNQGYYNKNEDLKIKEIWIKNQNVLVLKVKFEYKNDILKKKIIYNYNTNDAIDTVETKYDAARNKIRKATTTTTTVTAAAQSVTPITVTAQPQAATQTTTTATTAKKAQKEGTTPATTTAIGTTTAAAVATTATQTTTAAVTATTATPAATAIATTATGVITNTATTTAPAATAAVTAATNAAQTQTNKSQLNKKTKETVEQKSQILEEQLQRLENEAAELKATKIDLSTFLSDTKITISDEDAKNADEVFTAWKKVKTDLSDDVKGSFDVNADTTQKEITVTAKEGNDKCTGTVTLSYETTQTTQATPQSQTSSSNAWIWIISIILAIIGVSTAFYVNKKRK